MYLTDVIFRFLAVTWLICATPYGSRTSSKLASWAEWSSWSPCSRTCGTGVTFRTRSCLPPIRGSRGHGAHVCDGPRTVTKICNTKVCSKGSEDFRQAQCKRYDGKVLAGTAYNWIPFYHGGGGECALNCRAVGHRFYATLRPHVDDGTRCRPTSPTLHLCLAGVCKEVGCDGVVGSGAKQDMCGVCNGNNSTCRLVSGLFTRPQLPHGYNLITQIPKSASNITISQLRNTVNYIALRKKDGSYILNGNWAINLSGEYTGAGTKFIYQRDSRNADGEFVKSPGPLTEPVDLMLIFQQPNPGIKYQYQLPVSLDPVPAPPLLRLHQNGMSSPPIRHPHYLKNPDSQPLSDNSVHYARHSKPATTYGRDLTGTEVQNVVGDEAVKQRIKSKKKKFSWKSSGYSECSKSCGGGIQTPLFVCVRESNIVVAEKRCSSLEKPSVPPKRCNTKPCVAEWKTGEWTSCSVSCGEGLETREVLCRQEISATLTVTVANAACLTPPPPSSRQCFLTPCHGNQMVQRWQVGLWSECSVGCGNGVRTRRVHCPSGDCPLNDRPHHITQCTMAPCKNSRGYWLYSEWSNLCSAECGKGVQTRRVICYGGGECDQNLRPESTRACSSDKRCSGQWFTGPWQMCTGGCGTGEQWRNVVCMAHIHGESIVTSEVNCKLEEKPNNVQKCQLPSCSSQWFTGDWGTCSRSCDSGVQRREVWCLDENQGLSASCNEAQKPTAYHVCNTNSCSTSAIIERQQTEKEEKTKEKSQPHVDFLPNSDECIDKLHNCHMVVQARLCQYKYYSNSCCKSCLSKT